MLLKPRSYKPSNPSRQRWVSNALWRCYCPSKGYRVLRDSGRHSSAAFEDLGLTCVLRMYVCVRGHIFRDQVLFAFRLALWECGIM